jgi:hypothetical protein
MIQTTMAWETALELCLGIRSAGIPVIFLSANASAAWSEQCGVRLEFISQASLRRMLTLQASAADCATNV